MNVFDIFGGRNKAENRTVENPSFNFTSNSTVAFFTPTNFSDVEKIINVLKEGRNAVVHLNEVKTETAIRIIDMLSGAVYALGGGIQKIEKNVFMLSPTGVEIR